MRRADRGRRRAGIPPRVDPAGGRDVDRRAAPRGAARPRPGGARRRTRAAAIMRGWRTTRSGPGWRPRQAASARWRRPTPNASGRCARRVCSWSGHCASGPTSTPGERFELLVRLSRAQNFEGRMEDALRAAAEAVEIAQRELGRAAHGRALSVLAAALWSLDRMVEARAAARSAIAAARDDAPSSRSSHARTALTLRDRGGGVRPVGRGSARAATLEIAARRRARGGADRHRDQPRPRARPPGGARRGDRGWRARSRTRAAAGLHIQTSAHT